MSVVPAGTEVDYRITYLEMPDDPGLIEPSLPEGYRLEKAEDPPVWYFLSLYAAVGRDYEWQDKFLEDPGDVAAFVSDPRVELWTLTFKGWPQGFFQLDFREPGLCDLAYFGLVPEAVGAGVGRLLLTIALAKGWARDGVGRMTVNTCTLDHPAALGLYRKMGFRPVRTEDRKRTLTQDRVVPDFQGV
ncbi:GNAT family N-acetyltransferase [Rhodobacterales bacterium HKCCE3408]|nr:GNAT family N-acetyltransferase [Rhodobacterales bacterium HKCCE3408]